MDAKAIPLREQQTDAEGYLRRCLESGQSLVVQLPDSGLVAIQPLESDDDLINELIEHDPAFRALLAKSAASPRKPFQPATVPEEPG
jgi:hypothetical protein